MSKVILGVEVGKFYDGFYDEWWFLKIGRMLGIFGE